jgi:uncharacterized membrane-anchored protein YhcB (DUF1043 family)
MNIDSHTVFDIISAGVTIGWLIVGLLIKNSLGEIKLHQEENKAELIRQQQEVKDDLSAKHTELVSKQNDILTDFNQKHAENKQDLAVHIAEDRGSFATITSAQQINATTLARIEGKLNGFGGHS